MAVQETEFLAKMVKIKLLLSKKSFLACFWLVFGTHLFKLTRSYLFFFFSNPLFDETYLSVSIFSLNMAGTMPNSLLSRTTADGLG